MVTFIVQYWQAHVAMLLEVVIPLVAFDWARRRRLELPKPRKLIIAWLLVYFVSDLAGLVTLLNGIDNQWLRYIFTPVSDILVMLALASWQDHPLRRIGLRVALYLLVPVWLIYAIAEGTKSFGEISDPLRSIIVLIAALMTLIGNSLNTSRRISRADWFWVAAGVALYFALELALGPFLEYVLHNSRDVASRAYRLKASVDIIAFLLIGTGLLCPLDPARRSGSST